MAVKIKLKRLGKIRSPHYRIVIADARTKRDGRSIEEIGIYHPMENPSRIEVDSERAQYWLGVGAQPTEPVAHILKLTGDWQKYKGLPAPAPLRVPAEKADKKSLFEAAAREAMDEPKDGATTPKAKKEKKVEAPAETATPAAEGEAAAETAANEG